jgi:hypothetical protein
MLRELSSEWGAAGWVVRFRVEAGRFYAARLGIAALPLLLLLAKVWPPGKLFAQSADGDKPVNSTAKAAQTNPGILLPEPDAQPAAPAMLPPAMASKTKLPTESDYEDVHVLCSI